MNGCFMENALWEKHIKNCSREELERLSRNLLEMILEIEKFLNARPRIVR
jgi:hypothetical protein